MLELRPNCELCNGRNFPRGSHHSDAMREKRSTSLWSIVVRAESAMKQPQKINIVRPDIVLSAVEVKALPARLADAAISGAQTPEQNVSNNVTDFAV